MVAVCGTACTDLAILLRLLPAQSLEAFWTIASPDESEFEPTGTGGVRLEALASVSGQIRDDELLPNAVDTVQVVWGTSAGALRHVPERPGVIVRAFDNLYYEIETPEKAALAKIKSHYAMFD